MGTEQGRLYMILLSVLLLLGGVGLTSLLNVAVPAVSTLLMLAPVGLGWRWRPACPRYRWRWGSMPSGRGEPQEK